MAIKKDTLLKIAALLKIDPAKVEEALKSETEMDLPFDESIQVFSKTELESRDRQKYGEGKTAGEGMTIDNMFKEHGLDVSGKKDATAFAKALQDKVLKDANLSVDEKVKEKDKTILGLRENLKTYEQQLSDIKRQQQEFQLETEILSHTIHLKPDNLTNKEWTTLLKMNNEIVEQDGQLVVKRNGEIVKDPKELKPVPVKDALAAYVSERKLGKTIEEKPVPGRAGTDSKLTPGAITKMSQFKEKLQAEGVPLTGEKAQAMLKEVTAANPNFEFNN